MDGPQMLAMVLETPGGPLVARRLPLPEPGPRQVRVDIDACGVCRTDLHVLDGDLREARLPLILGHEIVGRVGKLGPEVQGVAIGQRVGVPWLGHVCGVCPYCRCGAENLCDAPGFTGYTRDGGYAEACIADAASLVPLPEAEEAAALAPLLCAGLIGYRSLVMTGEAQRLGIYGFGAAAHIVAQVARWQGRRVFAFTRPGDVEAQRFARTLGADWAGGSDEMPPQRLDAAIIFAPVGALVPAALAAVRKGGVVVCGGIHMSDIPAFPYRLLWEERVVRSVANLTRRDATEFFALSGPAGVTTTVERFVLDDANVALDRLRSGRIRGAAVLEINGAPTANPTDRPIVRD